MRCSISNIVALLAAFLVGSFPLLAQMPEPDSAAIELRVNSMLARMTTKEKINLLGGSDTFFTQAIPSIGLQRLRMADGPLGVRNWGPSTAYTAGIALAASWDTDLATRVGESLGNDSRARGVHFLLAPGVNIYRSPLNGRNMEYLGEDPWLTSRMAVSYIRGLQSKGVCATVKHFAANNSEFDRHRSDSIVDERTLHEIYLPAFKAAVEEAHVGAVMDSYNLINGDHATQNHTLNIDILKKEWGFQGIVMSDWDATYDGVAAANGGLDLEMPSGKFMNSETLLPAIEAGTVTMDTLDDKVRRILRTAVRFGWLDREQIDNSIPLLSPESSKIALDEALESVTLLKNENHLLPLDISRHIFVVLGPDAYPPIPGGGGSSRVESFFSDSILTGISNFVANRSKVFYIPGLPTAEHFFSETDFAAGDLSVFSGDTVDAKPEFQKETRKLDTWRENNIYLNDPARGGDEKGHTYLWHMTFVPHTTGRYLLVSATGSRDTSTIKVDGVAVMQQPSHDGAAVPAQAELALQKNTPTKLEIRYFTHATAPHLGLGLRAIDELFTPAERKLIASADATIVAVGLNSLYESEGYDRGFGLPWGQDELIASAVALNPRTIVDVQAGGAVDVHTWIDHVPVLIDSWYGGQSTGEALAQVLFGRSPGGKLPISWERTAEDNPTYKNYHKMLGPGRKISYTEGLFYGYRYYTSMHRQPLFPFGFGLSYTDFVMTDLNLTPNYPARHMRVDFNVRNSGHITGSEIAQVYVSDPSAKIQRPVRELKAFARVDLAPGATKHIVLNLDERAFSYYDVASHRWRMDPGRFDITVGDSSEDNRLSDHVTFPR